VEEHREKAIKNGAEEGLLALRSLSVAQGEQGPWGRDREDELQAQVPCMDVGVASNCTYYWSIPVTSVSWL
jgi:hypothetical protein